MSADSETSQAPTFTISLTLSVTDADRLWVAAAQRALLAPEARMEDVLDVIGPREDPSLSDCLAMLTMHGPTPGCRYQAFDVKREIAPDDQVESGEAEEGEWRQNKLPQALSRPIAFLPPKANDNFDQSWNEGAGAR